MRDRRDHEAVTRDLGVGIAILFTATACTASPAQHSVDAHATALPRKTAKSHNGRTYERGCDGAVYGRLGHGWRKNSVSVGPLSWVGLRRVARTRGGTFRHASGFYSIKALAVVKRGSSVEVRVPAKEARYVSLLYDPDDFKNYDSYQVSDGEPAVGFHACKAGQVASGPGPTQFSGGFVVVGPRCVALDIKIHSHLRRIEIPFGRATCSHGAG